MKKIISSMIVLCSLWLAATPAVAQQTTGSITGRILDDQGASVPGVTVTGKSDATGFVRTDVTDGEGMFRLTALPVGTYDLTAELSGFAKIENKGIVVNVGQTLDLNLTLKLAAVSETISVRAETPLIQTSSSSVGGVVDVSRLENLPLNGRQFANAALSIPGVGLGFHSDPTKSTQYSPQIGGGNGRNVNYQIDGGDNNDDTVGGLLQLFPLEAIQEFNFVTQRYKAEYGRSNGGVMNIVTKSGTNDFHGSWFTSIPRHVAQREDQDREDSTTCPRVSTSGISTADRSAARSCRTRRISSALSSARSRTRRNRSTRSGSSRTRTASSRRRCARTCSRRRPRRTSRRRSTCRSGMAATPTRRSTARRHAACRRAGATARTRSTRSTSTTTGCWADRS